MTVLRSTRPWARIGRLATAGALAATLVACGGSSGGGAPATPSPGAVLQGDPAVVVAAASTRTTAAKNARVELNGDVATMGQTVTLNGTGAIDFANQTFQLNLTVPGMGTIEERFLDEVIYVKIPDEQAAQFGGKPWLKIDPKAVSGSGGQNPFGSLDSSNPAQILATLQGAGSVTKVGDDTVRGARTVHYKADIDVAKAADAQKLTPAQRQQLQQALGGKSTIPADVWLDEQGLVRRLTIDIEASPPAGGAASSGSPTSVKTKISMEFFDYGQADTAVSAPPADQVTDFSQILGQLGQFSGGTSS